MSSQRTTRRALAALGALIVVAAAWVPSALAAIGPEVDTTLASPAITSTASAGIGTPVSAAPVDTGGTSDATVLVAPIPGPWIAEAIIERLRLPTGPVLLAPPLGAVESVPESAPAAPTVGPAVPAPTADTAAAIDAEAPRPVRDRNPSRSNADDDLVEVEVYGAAIPEPPEVASSTTTETVLVEPDPSDPWRAVRECEASGNYATNTGNGFYGAYQFTTRTWNWVAGIIGRPDLIGVRPDLASAADQDRMADALAFEVRGGGLGHWPVCGRLYGS